MRSKKVKHSKIRNTGLLFEFLLRHVTADVLGKKENGKSLDIIKKYFKENTEIGKELALYNVLITKSVSEELDLNPNFPYLEVYERNKNKSFIAKKAEISNEEKKVLDKAPITQIKIDNISNKPVVKKKDKKVNKKFSIIVGEFYSKEWANSLVDLLTNENIKKEVFKVKKLQKNKYQLTAGPYSSINTLKNDYFKLNKYGFENLDIKQND